MADMRKSVAVNHDVQFIVYIRDLSEHSASFLVGESDLYTAFGGPSSSSVSSDGLRAAREDGQAHQQQTEYGHVS
jgi:hypothetical protein